MNLQALFIAQMIADVILCVAIVFLLFVVAKETKKRETKPIDPEMISDFRKIIDESRDESLHLIAAMDESRKSLKETALALDEREKRVRFLLEEADRVASTIPSGNPAAAKGRPSALREPDSSADPYDDVLKMARQGFSKKEISRLSGLAEGEIDLIIDLDRKKNENA
jgi:hypothetical protein